MARVTVAPEAFSLVQFDAGRIRELVEEIARSVGLPGDLEIHLEVDEATPFGQTSTVILAGTPGPRGITGARVEIAVEGGAFEDPKHIRRLSEVGTRQVLGRLLFRVLDRLDPRFGSPPPDSELTLEQHAAWDAYAVGRYARLAGVDGGQARRRYAFRLRHGFTDVADRAFERLWFGSDLTWGELEALGEAARAAAP
jgi:hypothetical protein